MQTAQGVADRPAMTEEPVPAIRMLAGVSEIADLFDGFILDLWGVLHNGQRPYPGVVDCLQRLKRAGKRLVVLSNAPRRADAVIHRLGEIGIPPDGYDAVMTSGEDAWLHLRERGRPEADPWYRSLGPRCFHLGPEWDEGILRGLPIEIVEAPEAADFVLTTGVEARGDQLEKYDAVLRRIRVGDLPMICANPDLVVMHAGRREYCAGALAQRYEALGGQVRYHGKPHAAVYRRVMALMGSTVARDRVLAVGDSLRTDMAGATAFDIAGLLVTGGIHADEFAAAPGQPPDPTRIAAACRAAGLAPIAAIDGFRW